MAMHPVGAVLPVRAHTWAGEGTYTRSPIRVQVCQCSREPLTLSEHHNVQKPTCSVFIIPSHKLVRRFLFITYKMRIINIKQCHHYIKRRQSSCHHAARLDHKEKQSLPVWREPVISLRRYWANFMISRLHRFLQPLILSNKVFLWEEPGTFADRGNRSWQQTSEAVGSLATRLLPAAEPKLPRLLPSAACRAQPRGTGGHRRAPGGAGGPEPLPPQALPAHSPRPARRAPQPRGGATHPSHHTHTPQTSHTDTAHHHTHHTGSALPLRESAREKRARHRSILLGGGWKKINKSQHNMKRWI